MMHTRNKPNQQILDEAAEWFVDFREGDLDAGAQQSFNQWLRRSPEHITAYMEVAAFWADVPNVATKEDIDVPALIAYARAEDNIVPLVAAGRTSRREEAKPVDSTTAQVRLPPVTPRTTWSWAKGLLAASFAIALVGLTSWWSVIERGTYRTDVGEQRLIVLNDGSTVELNAKSRLRVRFSDEARNVELLQGQALFRVAKNPLRPFIVSSGGASVRAVGTQFDVYRKRSGTVVTVVEGKVAVVDSSMPVSGPAGQPSSSRSIEKRDNAAHIDPIFLSAGEQLIVGMKMPSQPKPADITMATAWTQRQIVFQGTPLGEVVEEFNRYNPRQMVVLDETLQSVRVSGVFSSTEPASLLHFLREQVHLKVIEGDESVKISR
jgi:transmembrane sensor